MFLGRNSEEISGMKTTALLLALVGLESGLALHATSARPAVRASVRAATSPSMLAKKRSKPRKPARPPSPPPYAPPIVSVSSTPDAPMAPASASSSSELPVDERLDAVLRKAGLTQDDQSAIEAARPSDDPLSKIPKAGQQLLERFFFGGAVVFGVIFISCGLAVAAEALATVLGSPLPEAIDSAIVAYAEPALTPSIVVLFGFSISLGLLKQLQMGSESAGVLYTENEDE